jgi:PAS domain S-box-containing protein
MRYLLVSRRWLDDHGLDERAVIGKSHDELFPEIPARWSEIHRRCLEGATEHCEEDAVVRPDGRIDWVRWEVRPFDDDDGAIGGIVIFSEDITARKRAEAALREREATLRAVVEGTSDAVFVKDAAGRYVLFNEAAGHFVGKRPSEVLGRDDTLLLPPDEARHAMEHERAIRVDGRTITYETEVTTADGVRRTFSVTKGPLHDANGAVTGIFGVARDMTERKRAEEAGKAKAADDEANRQKDRFIAMLGHELRNPLAAVQVAVERLLRRRERGGLDPDVERASEMIRRQAAQLVRLVDDLLEVSRAVTGKLALKKERTDAASAIRHAVETSRPFFDASGAQLEVVPPPEPIALDADPARLAQALTNLLTNAAKYTPSGGRVTLSTVRERGEIVFRVKDSGIGIAPEMLEAIFDLFVQTDHSLDRAQGGLGLGLPLVRRIAELHGGSVAAFSDGLGRGSELVMRIPVGETGRETTTAQTTTAQPPPAQPPQAARRRILVVDDNRDLAEGLAGLLEGAGHEVRMAHDGPSGLKMAEDFHPKVVFLDIGLPILDGYEVARRLRRLPGLEDIALVALSGYGEAKDRQQSKEAGFDLHLVKPSDLWKVEEVVESLVDGGL